MAGLEVVVRPFVFPNIRPAPARALAPTDNPTNGIATLGGSGGRTIELTHSFSISTSKSTTESETKRVVDVDRVYQVEEDGTINKKNYVDVERTTKARFEADDPDAGASPAERSRRAIKRIYGAHTPQPDNIETQETGNVITVTPDAE
jgi:hypothetical protein